MSGNFSARVTVDDLAALVAIENPADKTIRGIRDNSAASDGSGGFNWYHFVAGSGASTALPEVARDVTDTGAWLAQPGGGGGGGSEAIVVEGQPDRAPLQAGEQWIETFVDSIGGTEVTRLFTGVFTEGSLSGSNALNVGGGAWLIQIV